ncbi:MAG: helix-turn-helix domain-containing protein [bacterium]|nr:helix-turn-helix domain-containing protein [bacterium]
MRRTTVGTRRRRSSNRFRSRAGTFGRSLSYVHDLWIEHARNLLERTGLPLSEVAERVGCSDVAYLRRLFKRKVHVCLRVTPRMRVQS